MLKKDLLVFFEKIITVLMLKQAIALIRFAEMLLMSRVKLFQPRSIGQHLEVLVPIFVLLSLKSFNGMSSYGPDD